MAKSTKIPIIRGDDGELLGFVAKESTSWTAQTIFGYVIARVEDESSAEAVVRTEGLLILQGVWSYYDAVTSEWCPCIIKEAHENRVTIIRTNELGFQDTQHYKRVIIRNPTEATLLKG